MLPWKDSNSLEIYQWRNQNPVCYHYTTRQYLTKYTTRLFCVMRGASPFDDAKLMLFFQLTKYFFKKNEFFIDCSQADS